MREKFFNPKKNQHVLNVLGEVPIHQLKSIEPEKLKLLAFHKIPFLLIANGIEFEKFAILPFDVLKEFFGWIKKDAKRVTLLECRDTEAKAEIYRELLDLTLKAIRDQPDFLQTLEPFCSIHPMTPGFYTGHMKRLPNHLLSGKDRQHYSRSKLAKYVIEELIEQGLSEIEIIMALAKNNLVAVQNDDYCGFTTGFLIGERF